MNPNNETMTVKGFDYEDKLCPINHEQPYSDCSHGGKHYGMPITTCASIAMKKRFADQNNTQDPNNPFKDIVWVEFSKTSLFRILAQEECDFVRFYFAIPSATIKSASLVLEGVSCKHETIGRQTIINIGAAMDGQIADTGKIEEQRILQTLTVSPPPTEEKGNSGQPLTESLNIKSMREFLTLHGEGLVNKSISEFLEKFYEYADSNM